MLDVDYIIRSELACFKIIWHTPPMRSYLSGEFLRIYVNTQHSFSCCAHILSKAQNKYPHFRLYLKNIRLLTPREHLLLDQGTEDQRKTYSKEVERADWRKIWDLRAELEEEYKKHFPSTVGMLINYRYSDEEVINKIKVLNGLFLKKIQDNLSYSPQHK